MSAGFDALVIGGGVNGLAAAARMARGGLRTLVLERAERIGGQSALLEFTPGFRADPFGADAGWVPPGAARELALAPPARVIPDPSVAAPAGKGAWLALAPEEARAADAIRRFSPRDAERWSGFAERLAKLATFLQALYVLPAPDIDTTALGELWPLLGVARKLRGLGKADMVELLRTVPMSVQEWLDDWFECAPLKAMLGSLGVENIRQGPRSGGTAFVLLHHQVGAARGAIRGRGYWQAGPDALVDALREAAGRHGVTIRTGAAVERILVQDDQAAGVVLAGGEEIAAPIVVSDLDPARTFLGMVDPVWLDPEFLLAIRNIKFRGSTARVLYALDGLPEFAGLEESALRGTLTLAGSLDDLERAADDAKYGRASEAPAIDLVFPSLRWPALAPPGKHVAVAHVKSAPYRLRSGPWTAEGRSALGDRVSAAITRHAPDFADKVRHCDILTPDELERRYGLTEGAASHGELTLDQILFMRPVPGVSRYATPIPGLYLCGAGTHPGPGIAGGPGWLAARRVLKDRKEGRKGS